MNLISRSIQLDFQFVKLDLSFADKISFIAKKYLVLFKNFLFGFKKGESFIRLFGKKFFLMTNLLILFCKVYMSIMHS